MCSEKSLIETAILIDIKKAINTLYINSEYEITISSPISPLVFIVYHIYRITQSNYSYNFSSRINSTPSSACASNPLREINAYR